MTPPLMRGAILTHVCLHVAFSPIMKHLYCVVIDQQDGMSRWQDCCKWMVIGERCSAIGGKRLRPHVDHGESSVVYVFPPMHLILADYRSLYNLFAVSHLVPD